MDDTKEEMSETLNCSEISVGVSSSSTDSLSNINLNQVDGYQVQDKTILNNRSSIDSDLPFPSREPSLLDELRMSLENKTFMKLKSKPRINRTLEYSLNSSSASQNSTLDTDKAKSVVPKLNLFSRLRKNWNINFTLGDESSSSIENEPPNDASMNLSKVATSKPIFKRPQSKRVSVKFDCDVSQSDDSKASLDQESVLDVTSKLSEPSKIVGLRRTRSGGLRKRHETLEHVADFTLSNSLNSDTSTADSTASKAAMPPTANSSIGDLHVDSSISPETIEPTIAQGTCSQPPISTEHQVQEETLVNNQSSLDSALYFPPQEPLISSDLQTNSTNRSSTKLESEPVNPSDSPGLENSTLDKEETVPASKKLFCSTRLRKKDVNIDWTLEDESSLSIDNDQPNESSVNLSKIATCKPIFKRLQSKRFSVKFDCEDLVSEDSNASIDRESLLDDRAKPSKIAGLRSSRSGLKKSKKSLKSIADFTVSESQDSTNVSLMESQKSAIRPDIQNQRKDESNLPITTSDPTSESDILHLVLSPIIEPFEGEPDGVSQSPLQNMLVKNSALPEETCYRKQTGDNTLVDSPLTTTLDDISDKSFKQKEHDGLGDLSNYEYAAITTTNATSTDSAHQQRSTSKDGHNVHSDTNGRSRASPTTKAPSSPSLGLPDVNSEVDVPKKIPCTDECRIDPIKESAVLDIPLPTSPVVDAVIGESTSKQEKQSHSKDSRKHKNAARKSSNTSKVVSTDSAVQPPSNYDCDGNVNVDTNSCNPVNVKNNVTLSPNLVQGEPAIPLTVHISNDPFKESTVLPLSIIVDADAVVGESMPIHEEQSHSSDSRTRKNAARKSTNTSTVVSTVQSSSKDGHDNVNDDTNACSPVINVTNDVPSSSNLGPGGPAIPLTVHISKDPMKESTVLPLSIIVDADTVVGESMPIHEEQSHSSDSRTRKNAARLSSNTSKVQPYSKDGHDNVYDDTNACSPVINPTNDVRSSPNLGPILREVQGGPSISAAVDSGRDPINENAALPPRIIVVPLSTTQNSGTDSSASKSLMSPTAKTCTSFLRAVGSTSTKTIEPITIAHGAGSQPPISTEHQVQDETLVINQSSFDANLSELSREPLIEAHRDSLMDYSPSDTPGSQNSTLDKEETVPASKKLFCSTRLRKKDVNIDWTLEDESSLSIDNDQPNESSVNLSKIATCKPIFKRLQSKRVSVKFDCEDLVSEDSNASIDRESLLDDRAKPCKIAGLRSSRSGLKKSKKSLKSIADFTVSESQDSTNVSLMESQKSAIRPDIQNLRNDESSLPITTSDPTSESDTLHLVLSPISEPFEGEPDGVSPARTSLNESRRNTKENTLVGTPLTTTLDDITDKSFKQNEQGGHLSTSEDGHNNVHSDTNGPSLASPTTNAPLSPNLGLPEVNSEVDVTPKILCTDECFRDPINESEVLDIPLPPSPVVDAVIGESTSKPEEQSHSKDSRNYKNAARKSSNASKVVSTDSAVQPPSNYDCHDNVNADTNACSPVINVTIYVPLSPDLGLPEVNSEVNVTPKIPCTGECYRDPINESAVLDIPPPSSPVVDAVIGESTSKPEEQSHSKDSRKYKNAARKSSNTSKVVSTDSAVQPPSNYDCHDNVNADTNARSPVINVTNDVPLSTDLGLPEVYSEVNVTPKIPCTDECYRDPINESAVLDIPPPSSPVVDAVIGESTSKPEEQSHSKDSRKYKNAARKSSNTSKVVSTDSAVQPPSNYDCHDNVNADTNARSPVINVTNDVPLSTDLGLPEVYSEVNVTPKIPCTDECYRDPINESAVLDIPLPQSPVVDAVIEEQNHSKDSRKHKNAARKSSNTSKVVSTDSAVQPPSNYDCHDNVNADTNARSPVINVTNDVPLSPDLGPGGPPIPLTVDSGRDPIKENTVIDTPVPPLVIAHGANQQTLPEKLPTSKRKRVSFKPAHQNTYHSPTEYQNYPANQNSSSSSSCKDSGGYDEFSKIQMTAELSEIQTSVRMTRSKRHYSSTPLPKPKKQLTTNLTIRREAKSDNQIFASPVSIKAPAGNDFLVPPPPLFATKPITRVSSGGLSPLNPVNPAEPSPKEGEKLEASGRHSSSSVKSSVDLSYEQSLNISAIPRDQTAPKWGNVFHSTPKNKSKKKCSSTSPHRVDDGKLVIDRSINTSRKLRSRSREESQISKSSGSSQGSDEPGHSDRSSLQSKSKSSISIRTEESSIGSPQPLSSSCSNDNSSPNKVSMKNSTVLSSHVHSHSRARDFASSKTSRSPYLTRNSSQSSYDSHRKMPSRRLFTCVEIADEKENEVIPEVNVGSPVGRNVSNTSGSLAMEISSSKQCDLLHDDGSSNYEVALSSSVASSSAGSVAPYILPHKSFESQIDSLRSIRASGSENSLLEHSAKCAVEPKKPRSKFSRPKPKSENASIFPKRSKRRRVKSSSGSEEEWLKKPRKLYKPGKWASKKFYLWLENKLRPDHGLRTTLMSEKFVIDLQHLVVMVDTGHMDGVIERLRQRTVELKLCTNEMELWSLVHQWMPLDFRMKVMPLGGAFNSVIAPRRLPYDPLIF